MKLRGALWFAAGWAFLLVVWLFLSLPIIMLCVMWHHIVN